MAKDPERGPHLQISVCPEALSINNTHIGT